MPRRVHRAAVLFLALVGGCGYGVVTGANRMPARARQVFVRPLENRTTDAEAGGLVAASLRRELARRGAEGGPEAPGRLEGAVEEVTFGASSPGGATYRMALTVSARLVVGEDVLVQQRARREEDFLAGRDALESEGRRRLALRRAADAVAREILDRFEQP